MRLLLISALLLGAAGVAHSEDRAQRPSKRGRMLGRRGARRREQPASAPAPVPLWASIPIGVGLGAAVLPLSPVYAAIALGVTQAPGSRMLLGRAASAVGGALGIRRAQPPTEDVTVRMFARALNAHLPNIVDQLEQVPVFLVVDELGKPLKIAVGDDASSNFTFAYLEYQDAQALTNGLRTPDGEPVETTKIVGASLGSVVRGYIERRDQEGTDEMLIMPSSLEVKTAQELMSRMGATNTLVPNSVPIYQVEGLRADGGAPEDAPGAEGAERAAGGAGEASTAPAPVLTFFRFSDMQGRIKELKAADPDAMPQLKVRIMRLHELSQLTGTERMPDKPTFIPSTNAVTDLAALRKKGQDASKVLQPA